MTAGDSEARETTPAATERPGSTDDGRSNEDGDVQAVEITRRPTRIAAAVSAGAGAIALLIAGWTSTAALLVALVGAIALGAGLGVGRHGLVDLGGLGLFAGVALAGFTAAPEATLVGVVAVVVAWDVGCAAITLGAQLGRDARTRRLELRYACSSVLVGLGAATLGYAAFGRGGGLPLDAVVTLLVVAVAATIALGARRGWNDRGVGRARSGGR